jgi:S1/P1 Nuclease
MNIQDVQGSAMTWAQQANAFACSDVLVDGVSAVEGEDLDGSYYTAHVNVAQTQIATAGHRLGAWLNLVVTGPTS